MRSSDSHYKNHCSELAAYVEVFHGLLPVGVSLVENHRKATTSCLITEEGIFENTIRQTMKSINLNVFYGRALLFHVLSLPLLFYLRLKFTLLATGLVKTLRERLGCLYGDVF